MISPVAGVDRERAAGVVVQAVGERAGVVHAGLADHGSVGGILVDPEQLLGVVQDLLENAYARAIQVAVALPGHDDVAIVEHGDVGIGLVGRGGDDGLLLHEGAVGVVARHDHMVVPARAVLPDDDEAAVRGGVDLHSAVHVGPARAHLDLAAHRRAVGAVTLEEEGVAAAGIGRLPDNHEAAVRQGRDVGVDLVAAGRAVDLDLAADLGAAGIEPLHRDAPTGAVQ